MCPGQELGSFKIVKIVYAVVRLLATIACADVTSSPKLPSTNENVQTQIALRTSCRNHILNTSIGNRPCDKKFDNPKAVATLP